MSLITRIQSRHTGAGVRIDLNAAHQIVLTRVDRDAVLRHIIALFEEIVVDHREPVSDLVRVFVRNIEVKVIRPGTSALQHDGIGNG